MKRKLLSKKEIKELNETLSKYSISFDKKEKIEIVDDKFYFIEKELQFFLYEETLIPSLKYQLKQGIKLPCVTVDMGAVKFIVNGADIMRPGIKDISEELSPGSIVTIIDEQNKRPLVIGKLLFSSEEITNKDSGKVITNIHYIGDDLWNMVL